MFGLNLKKKSQPEDSHLNEWIIRGRVGRLSKTKHGAYFTVSTAKTLINGEEKLLHHQVRMNAMLSDEYFEDLTEGMLVQVVGEMFYSEKPYNLAKSLEIIC